MGINVTADTMSSTPKWISVGVTKARTPLAARFGPSRAPSEMATKTSPIRLAAAVPVS
jgi:hypothetical protein